MSMFAPKTVVECREHCLTCRFGVVQESLGDTYLVRFNGQNVMKRESDLLEAKHPAVNLGIDPAEAFILASFIPLAGPKVLATHPGIQRHIVEYMTHLGQSRGEERSSFMADEKFTSVGAVNAITSGLLALRDRSQRYDLDTIEDVLHLGGQVCQALDEKRFSKNDAKEVSHWLDHMVDSAALSLFGRSLAFNQAHTDAQAQE
jgi:hypothetical protein